MSTQAYIRKVVEDTDEDEDFKRAAWVNAVQFVNSHRGVVSGCLDDINKFLKNGKLDKVVAVIKSATPNALCDMTVTLKDPKGTISGTIHHKVLTDGKFGKGICAGSALILHNVSVFSPKQSTHYLNITKRNLVKAFYKDGGSSQKQTLVVSAAPGSESGRLTQMSGSAFSLERGAERFSNVIRRNTDNNNQSMHIDDEQDNVNPVSSIGKQCSKTSNEATNQNIVTDEEMLAIADAIESNENVTRGIKIGQPTVSASLPLWTDEQLDELLDADFDDLP